jgi:hypothetical protein
MKGGSTALLHFVATCWVTQVPERRGGYWARVPRIRDRKAGHVRPRSGPRALRERVRPEVRLETPSRVPAGRATASGHRAVPKHEAKLCEERKREYGRSDEGERGEYNLSVWLGTRQQHGDSVRHGLRDLRTLAVTGKVDMVPMVEANGSKPISPSASPLNRIVCLLRNCSWGGGRSTVPPEDSFCSAYGQVLACGRLRGASIHRAK